MCAPQKSVKVRRKGWERKIARRLPKSLVVASTAGSNSILLDIELRTTDTNATCRVKALLDSGATGMFIDADFVKRNGWSVRELSRSIPVFNVDGTLNEAGSIRSVADLVLSYDDHSERTAFAVTGLGKHDVILGFPWLQSHNPEVDWSNKKVRLNRCPRGCSTCLQRTKAHHLFIFLSSLSPSVPIDPCLSLSALFVWVL